MRRVGAQGKQEALAPAQKTEKREEKITKLTPKTEERIPGKGRGGFADEAERKKAPGKDDGVTKTKRRQKKKEGENRQFHYSEVRGKLEGILNKSEAKGGHIGHFKIPPRTDGTHLEKNPQQKTPTPGGGRGRTGMRVRAPPFPPACHQVEKTRGEERRKKRSTTGNLQPIGQSKKGGITTCLESVTIWTTLVPKTKSMWDKKKGLTKRVGGSKL